MESEKKLEQKLQQYKKFAKRGISKYMYLLGMSYKYGNIPGTDLHCKPMIASAIYWLLKAVLDTEIPNYCCILYELGDCYEYYLSKPDYRNAFVYYAQAATNDCSRAQYAMGRFNEKGIVVDCDLDTAFTWYKASAEKENCCAQYSLARFYENGISVLQSSDNALKWYLRSAKQGCQKAQYRLGKFYEIGFLVSKSFATAKTYYKLSAKQGNSDAQFALGMLYYTDKV